MRLAINSWQSEIRDVRSLEDVNWTSKFNQFTVNYRLKRPYLHCRVYCELIPSVSASVSHIIELWLLGRSSISQNRMRWDVYLVLIKRHICKVGFSIFLRLRDCDLTQRLSSFRLSHHHALESRLARLSVFLIGSTLWVHRPNSCHAMHGKGLRGAA